jgi:hypothetical protein
MMRKPALKPISDKRKIIITYMIKDVESQKINK